MGEDISDKIKHRSYARWWTINPDLVNKLEGESLRLDRTIRRLEAYEIEDNLDLASIQLRYHAEPEDVLAYIAYAEGLFGCFRIAALFIRRPDNQQPIVLCLDGPRGKLASEHRFSETELCLFFVKDPTERRWKLDDGLIRLFDLARRHLTCEHLWRETREWPVEEVAHDETEPAPSDPSLALPPLIQPNRNEPCNCGSGIKAKWCCWKWQ